MENRAFVTAKQFAQAAQVDTATIRTLCRAGKLNAQKTPGGGHWRIPAAELARWLKGFRDGGEVHHGSE